MKVREHGIEYVPLYFPLFVLLAFFSNIKAALEGQLR